MSDTLIDWGDSSPTLRVPLRPQCDQCQLYKHCNSPKMSVHGQGKRGILVVAEFPAEAEDRTGIPLSGNTGRLVSDTLAKFGVDLRRDCWTTNARICAGKNPPKRVVEMCRPNIVKTIRDLKPRVILLMGADAIESVLGWLWKPSPGTVERWAGWEIPDQTINSWVIPTIQPAWLFHEKENKLGPVPRMEFEHHVQRACELEGTPWPNGPPDYQSRVEVIVSPTEAARRLKKYTTGDIAWDTESSCLKPDGSDSFIYSAAVCWEGRETIAFPWTGSVIPEMHRILTSPDMGKIGWNLKHDERWVWSKLGCPVTPWKHDGMLTAHALSPRSGKEGDNRKAGGGISGLKFQSYVRLGQRDYSSHLDKYLHSSGKSCYAPNRIRDADVRKVLLYNGMDALGTWEISQIQMKELARGSDT